MRVQKEFDLPRRDLDVVGVVAKRRLRQFFDCRLERLALEGLGKVRGEIVIRVAERHEFLPHSLQRDRSRQLRTSLPPDARRMTPAIQSRGSSLVPMLTS